MVYYKWIVGLLALAVGESILAEAPDSKFQLHWQNLEHLDLELTAQEMTAIETAIAGAREISSRAEAKNGLPYRRDAHAKATGCVRATFSVNADIPERYRHSVFRQPGREYQAWIRFSNGDMLVQPDNKPDARGMAIKLMQVEGKPIAPELASDAVLSHDFIMTNTRAFFNRNIFDYAEDIQYLAKFERTRWFVSLFPPRLHPRQLYRAVQTVSSRINTPLEAQYYSMLPYLLGDTALKFSARPCAGMSFAIPTDKEHPDFLNRQLVAKLATGAACFDFLVQPQVPGAHMPLDDATVIWSEARSPLIPVARVHIPPQQLDDPMLAPFCENLSMNPWRGVGEWRPLGSLSKARRVVYAAVSKYRSAMNHVGIVEPKNWCVNAEVKTCSPTEGLVITQSRWPLPRCFDHLYAPLDDSDVDSQCE